MPREENEEIHLLDHHEQPPRSMHVGGRKLDSLAAAGCESQASQRSPLRPDRDNPLRAGDRQDHCHR